MTGPLRDGTRTGTAPEDPRPADPSNAPSAKSRPATGSNATATAPDTQPAGDRKPSGRGSDGKSEERPRPQRKRRGSRTAKRNGSGGKRAGQAKGRKAPPALPGETVYAALDLGTNNCRLLCARPSRRGFTVVDAFSRIIRLGEGVSQSGELSLAAMNRTIRALRVCSEKMARLDVKRARLIATEACRIARNGDHFIERVRNETGLRLEIVNRETEAKLAVSGCASLIDRESDWALVFDIGGGSTELIWLDMTKRENTWGRTLSDRMDAHNCISAWTSLPVGVVTLAEKFGGKFVDDTVFEAMVSYVYGLLEEFEAKHRINEVSAGRNVHLLGTSGTVTTVAGIHLQLPRYDRRRVDGCWLHVDEARSVTSTLVAKTYDERIAEPCIGTDRADLVLAGCAILEALLRMWPCERLRVADRGLREGILSLLMAEDGVHERPRSRRRRGRNGRQS